MPPKRKVKLTTKREVPVKRVRRTFKCSHEGCTKIVVQGGACTRHGAKRLGCSHEGCTNGAVKGGVCIKHGAEVKKCSHEGCSSYAKKGGVCIQHGAEVKKCSHEGCSSYAKKGGVCCRHGANVTRQTQKGRTNARPTKPTRNKSIPSPSTVNDDEQDLNNLTGQKLNDLPVSGVRSKLSKRLHGAKNWKEKQEHYVSDSEGSGSCLLTDSNKNESREAAQAIFVPPSLPSPNGKSSLNQRLAAIYASNANRGPSKAVDVATRTFVNGNVYVLDIDESSTAVGILPISPPNTGVCRPILEPKMGPATPQQCRSIDPTVQRTDVVDQGLMVQRLQQENEELRKKIDEATVANVVAEREALEATKRAINATVAKVVAERYATVVKEAAEQETLVAEKRAAEAERRLKEIIEIKEATEQTWMAAYAA